MTRERLIELLLDNGFRFMQESERSERYIWKNGHDFIIITICRRKNGIHVERFTSGHPLKKMARMNAVVNDVLDRDWMDELEILAYIEDNHIGNPFF